ncbi:MAG: hypothetical protein DRJ08_00740 [Acidobacteria bacterium]|nr:MAG: hypothetical protein DRJ08_00740 [Acidobacteriota bacterium]
MSLLLDVHIKACISHSLRNISGFNHIDIDRILPEKLDSCQKSEKECFNSKFGEYEPSFLNFIILGKMRYNI